MSAATTAIAEPLVQARTRERLMLFGPRTPLSGIYTHPVTFDGEKPCIVMLNAGIIHKVGPNRMYVRFAREAADRNFPVFRFDFSGVGDTPPRGDGLSLSEGVLADVSDALDHLEAYTGIRRFVLLGLCAGADNALRAARQDARVVGLVMLDPAAHPTWKFYLIKTMQRLSDPEFYRELITFSHPRLRAIPRRLAAMIKPAVDDDLAATRPELFRIGLKDKDQIGLYLGEQLERGTQLFYAYTGSWVGIYNYENQLRDQFPELNFDSHLELKMYPDAEHTFDLESHKRQLFDDVLGWLARAQFRSEP